MKRFLQSQPTHCTGNVVGAAKDLPVHHDTCTYTGTHGNKNCILASLRFTLPMLAENAACAIAVHHNVAAPCNSRHHLHDWIIFPTWNIWCPHRAGLLPAYSRHGNSNGFNIGFCKELL